MNRDQFLEWARSLEGYQRAVRRFIEELGWPEDAAREVCDLTAMAETRLGRRIICAEDRR